MAAPAGGDPVPRHSRGESERASSGLTTTHEAAADAEGQALCDADLGILAAPGKGMRAVLEADLPGNPRTMPPARPHEVVDRDIGSGF